MDEQQEKSQAGVPAGQVAGNGAVLPEAGLVRPRPVFLPALIFGTVLGLIIFIYRIQVGTPAGAAGSQPAALADAILAGLSSLALYAFLYAFIQWAWRTKIHPLPGLTWKSRGTGFFSALIFLAALILIAVLGNLLT